MLTNRPRSFLKSQNFEIGLSDCHKLVVCVLRALQKSSEKNCNLQRSKALKPGPFFFEISTTDYFKASFTEIVMSLTKKFLTIYLIITP